MIIFDHFETVADAATFAAGVLEVDASLDLVITTVRLDYFKTFAADPAGDQPSPVVEQVAVDYLFPFELDGVIVYVEREGDDDGELIAELSDLAVAAGGRWAGT